MINLSPEKHKVYAEAYRVLRPGGSILFFEPNQLNPQVAFEKTLGRLLMAKAIQVSPTERTFSRWTYARYLRDSGFGSVRVKPFDFVHPLTPRMAVGLVDALGRFVEHVPIFREISGSLLLQAKRPNRPHIYGASIAGNDASDMIAESTPTGAESGADVAQ